jgi:hypothetical protein
MTPIEQNYYEYRYDCGTKYDLILIKSEDDIPPTLPREA